jgi:hypothetical protein
MTLELLEDTAAGQFRFRMLRPSGVMRSMNGIWAVQASPDRSGVLHVPVVLYVWAQVLREDVPLARPEEGTVHTQGCGWCRASPWS